MIPGRFFGVILLALTAAGLPLSAMAQSPAKPADVHFIWMGGDDCPPCVVWRAEHLPKLEKTAVFKEITFSYVTKVIRSSVPPHLLLPESVKPLKEKLDVASAGRIGSPQVAVMVNGEVYDYFFGSRSAEDIEEMLLAARYGGRYPFPRCVKLEADGRGCAVKG